jgi:hypothetical protein
MKAQLQQDLWHSLRNRTSLKVFSASVPPALVKGATGDARSASGRYRTERSPWCRREEAAGTSLHLQVPAAVAAPAEDARDGPAPCGGGRERTREVERELHPSP